MANPGLGFLYLRLALWALIAFGASGLVMLKAVLAMRANERYRLTFVDGGLFFHGKETSPGLMLGLAVAYALGVSTLLASPLGLYEWLDNTTSACRDVIPLADLPRLSGGKTGAVSIHDHRTTCTLDVDGSTYGVVLRLEISGYGRGGRPEEAVRVVTANGARVMRVDGPTKHALWIDGPVSGSIGVTLDNATFDEAALREIASMLEARADTIERYSAAWRKKPGIVSRVLGPSGPFVLFVSSFVLLGVGGVAVFRARRERAMKRALDET